MGKTRAAFVVDADGYLRPVKLTLQPLPALQVPLRHTLAQFAATRHLQYVGAAAIAGSRLTTAAATEFGSARSSAAVASGPSAAGAPILPQQCVVAAMQPLSTSAIEGAEEFMLVRSSAQLRG